MKNKKLLFMLKQTKVWNDLISDQNNLCIILGGSRGIHLNDSKSDYDIFVYRLFQSDCYEPYLHYKTLKYKNDSISISFISIFDLIKKNNFLLATGMTKHLESIRNKNNILYKTTGKYEKMSNVILSEDFSKKLIELGSILVYEYLTKYFINLIKNNQFQNYYKNQNFKQIYSILYIGKILSNIDLDNSIFIKIKKYQTLNQDEINIVNTVLNYFIKYAESHLNNKIFISSSIEKDLIDAY